MLSLTLQFKLHSELNKYIFCADSDKKLSKFKKIIIILKEKIFFLWEIWHKSYTWSTIKG